MRPKVFIGSSTNGLRIAEAIQRELSRDTAPTIWSQGIFRHTNVPIEDLMSAVSDFDFAVFVFLPEDTVQIRGSEAVTVRDNVLFELGLFLGKLGRQRNFFVTPRKDGASKVELHLPSDLSGITPAAYDPDGDLQSSIGTALFDVKKAIRELGTLGTRQTVIYDSRQGFRTFHFAHRNGYFWKGNEKTSPRSEGRLRFVEGGVLRIERENPDGRYEVELRQDGPDRPSIAKEVEPVLRVFRVTCQARAQEGAHTIRFVLKNLQSMKWAASETTEVSNQDWTPIEMYLQASPYVDLLFRIDDEKPAHAPSSLELRNLVITEES